MQTLNKDAENAAVLLAPAVGFTDYRMRVTATKLVCADLKAVVAQDRVRAEIAAWNAEVESKKAARRKRL